ncbi:hypothetical protein MnBA_13900 [Marinobacterium sp. BA1]
MNCIRIPKYAAERQEHEGTDKNTELEKHRLVMRYELGKQSRCKCDGFGVTQRNSQST